MRFMVGQVGSGTAVFAVNGDRAVNLSAALPGIGEDLSALAADPALVTQAANYVEHIKESGYDIPDYPAIFMRGHNSIMAAGAPLVRPRCSETLDYEAELMVIIGRGGRHISEEAALQHVFGYTVFNDGSVREYQRKTHQWTPGKNFDNTGAIGPVVVTPDEVPAGAAGLKIESRVGDEILQSSNTANMIWSVAKTLSIISEYTTLEPGDHIALGTPPGVGHAKKPEPRWLKPGETIEIEIEGIGVCANPVVDEEATHA